MSKRRPYTRPMKASWWQQNAYFMRYILRESTSVFVLVLCVELVYALYVLGKGEGAWLQFTQWLASPLALGFHLLCFIAVIIHTGSWFVLAPKTMDLRLKGVKVADKAITTAHYIAFAISSVAILAIVGGWL